MRRLCAIALQEIGMTEDEKSRIKQELARQFGIASGHGVLTHGINQWELVVDQLFKIVEKIVEEKIGS